MRRPLAALALVCTLGAGSLFAQQLTGPLVVFNAGSLAYPVRDLLAAFQRAHPGDRADAGEFGQPGGGPEAHRAGKTDRLP